MRWKLLRALNNFSNWFIISRDKNIRIVANPWFQEASITANIDTLFTCHSLASPREICSLQSPIFEPEDCVTYITLSPYSFFSCAFLLRGGALPVKVSRASLWAVPFVSFCSVHDLASCAKEPLCCCPAASVNWIWLSVYTFGEVGPAHGSLPGYPTSLHRWHQTSIVSVW